MIDLGRVKSILNEDVKPLVSRLHGVYLDDGDGLESQTKSRERTFKAEKTRELLLLADRLELAAGLVRNEYWFGKGEVDAFDPQRDD